LSWIKLNEQTSQTDPVRGRANTDNEFGFFRDQSDHHLYRHIALLKQRDGAVCSGAGRNLTVLCDSGKPTADVLSSEQPIVEET
jgi:hypothetical protein